MSRFGTDFSKEPVKHKELDDSPSSNFFNRVSIKSEIEQKKVEEQSLETDNSEHLLQQERQEQERLPSTKKTAKSLFSDNHEINIKAEKKYISPFSVNNKDSKEISEHEEESDVFSRSRLTFYGYVVLFVYLIILGIGYHYTTFSEDVPQIVSVEDRKNQVYLSKADEYITSLQNVHAEILSTTDNYSNNIIADAELNRTMISSREKIVKLQEELNDIIPPDSSQHFQSQLNELYSLQLTFCDNVIAYLKNKNDSTLLATKKANQNYEDKMTSFLQEYNSMFIKI